MTVSIFNALTVVAVGFLFVVAFVVDRLRARVKELERRAGSVPAVIFDTGVYGESRDGGGAA